MSKDVGGQLCFDGSELPNPPAKPKPPMPDGPIHNKHRIFNLVKGEDGMLALKPDNFIEKDTDGKVIER